MGAAVQGPVTQAKFLNELGHRGARRRLDARMQRREQADAIDARRSRACTESGKTGMGDLFKVMAICDPKLGRVAGIGVRHEGALAVARRMQQVFATPSSRAMAACRTAFMPASMAASARTTMRRMWRKTAPAWRAHLDVTPDRFLSAYQIHSPQVVVADAPWTERCAAQGRRHRDDDARPCDRRQHRRLRSATVCRRRGARHRCGACRLARRVLRRASRTRSPRWKSSAPIAAGSARRSGR